MKHSMNKSGKQQKNLHSKGMSFIKKLKLWQKIAIISILILSAFSITGYSIWSARHAKNITKYELQVNTPSAGTFNDTKTLDFIDDGRPSPNNNREISAPNNLVILFEQQSGPYTPALRMDISDQDIASNIKINPAISGKWQRNGPNEILFTPKHDWPADMKFTVKINQNIINSDVKVDSTNISFKTADIVATVDNFNIYPAQTPKSVIGVAVISFNYPIDTKKFQDRVSMRINGDLVNFSVKFDRFHRTAFITSDEIKITDEAQILRLKINRIPSADDNAATKKITATATIESADNIFKIKDISTTVADDTNGLPQQLILLNMTTKASANTNWQKYINVYLLPKYKGKNADDTDEPHRWSDDEITDSVLKNSKKLSITPVDFENPTGVYQYAFSYDVSEKTNRYIYLTVQNGISSASGLELKNGSSRVMQVPYPAKTVKIAGSGALLSMGGDRKLGLAARGGADAAYINLYKVKSSEINHLISQTYNVFGNIEFTSWSFGVYDMSVVFKKHVNFADTSMKSVNYASVDLGDYLDRTHADKTGIFIVQAGTSQNQADYSDQRLILLTDLGIVRKVNLDETSDVFVSELSSGNAASDVEITVLGRNGNAIWAGLTNADGHAKIPSLPWSEYRNEKTPVAIVARRGNDISFIQYTNGAYERRVEYSKFDVDGVYASNTNALNAYMFTDRGIYRPGENMVIGGIVKSKSFKSLAGIPVKIEMRNARGRVVLEKMFSLNSDGMFDIKYDVKSDAPTGEYNAYIYSLNTKNKIQDMLGSTSFRVEEFMPDNLKISASIPGSDAPGWLSPNNLSASVTLRNMFGTPATDKRISAKIILTPTAFEFKNYPQYQFTDNFISGTGLSDNAAIRTITQELDNIKTNADGMANINLDISDKISDAATYAMTMIVHGFEGGTGRGVQTAIRTNVSNSKYLIGWHANSDLSYINKSAYRNVNFIAIDHTAERTTASDLTMRLVRRENLTSLIKDYNDYYKYQTVSRDKVVMQQNVSIGPDGLDINLDTSTPGTYYLQIIDTSDRLLANIEYFVAGDKNIDMQADSRAELAIKLNSNEYAAGDDIAVSVTAPYSGYGLITIERDKVYAYQWFKTSNTNSVQHIKVPDGFEGTGYVNVSFVRDINSRDIFTTPYTYAVAPFTADIARRKIAVELSAPEKITDNKLTVKYETNANARMMIFAINDGILQVAKYQVPNPIAHFFKKAALQVDTYQILSLILPEYKILYEFAKTGGGDYDDAGEGTAGLTNPFARRTDAPVAFYSEIINTTANTPGEITFDIPNTFNGALRVFAVATNTSSMGAANRTVQVQSPIVVTLNAPTVVAPGDQFDVNAVISNLTDQNTKNKVLASAKTTGDIKITTAPTTTLEIPNMTEKLWQIGAAAGKNLGSAEISVGAKIENIAQRSATATMSVRPITPFTTNIQAGTINGPETKITIKPIDMYSEFATRTLYVSDTADIIVRPLAQYLAEYEWNCSEQITSCAMPYAIIGDSKIIGFNNADATKKITDAIAALSNRQNDDGSFAMWPSDRTSANDNAANADTAYLTAYVAQFLTIAQSKGFNVPKSMLARAIEYLRTYCGTKIRDIKDAQTHAFAIYVVTSNEYVTTSYINLFEEWANANIKNWQSGLSGSYIAASYKIMHQNDRAEDIFEKYRATQSGNTSIFDNAIANDAFHQYLGRKYFATGNAMPNKSQMEYINSGRYTAFTSAALIMGLGGTDTEKAQRSDITITADDKNIELDSNGANIIAQIPMSASKINISCPSCGKSSAMYWTSIQQGYPRSVKTEAHGIELTRQYYDANGNRITSAKIGDRITVKIFARTRGDVENIQNAVIVDLLPGGFIVDSDTITGNYEFAQPREDRVVIYTPLNRNTSEYSYTAQVTTAGTFAIAPIHAISMSNANLYATGHDGTFTVTNETETQE